MTSVGGSGTFQLIECAVVVYVLLFRVCACWFLYPIPGVFYIDMSLLSYGFGGVATYKVPTVIPWAGVEPLLSPKGWGSVATSPPKPHWGGADSHVIWPGVCSGLTRTSSSAHAWPARYTSYASRDLWVAGLAPVKGMCCVNKASLCQGREAISALCGDIS